MVSGWILGWGVKTVEFLGVGQLCQHDEGVERAEVLLTEFFPVMPQKMDKGHGRGSLGEPTETGRWVLRMLPAGD